MNSHENAQLVSALIDQVEPLKLNVKEVVTPLNNNVVDLEPLFIRLVEGGWLNKEMYEHTISGLAKQPTLRE
ncbi:MULTISPECIES: hypothetical protein [Bacillaceae]|uniref:hypothetical protein n=1 Tax=Bacillaceae TaxID=186817 RepID=UPI0023529394|nr:hypothetical protein [Bacillus weihaiensis]